jgi:hypothetical protein
MSNVVKFPYSSARRIYSRMPRKSKNGTPEERAAKAAELRSMPAELVVLPYLPPAIDGRKLRGNPMRDYIPVISFGSTVCGRLFTPSLKGGRLADVPADLRTTWLVDVQSAREAMAKLSTGLAQAAETLCNSLDGDEPSERGLATEHER